jgi:hypothetical protein
MTDAWKRYAGDFNHLTDEQIEFECESARIDLAYFAETGVVEIAGPLLDAEDWLEAVASWEAAGRPRKAALEENK